MTGGHTELSNSDECISPRKKSSSSITKIPPSMHRIGKKGKDNPATINNQFFNFLFRNKERNDLPKVVVRTASTKIYQLGWHKVKGFRIQTAVPIGVTNTAAATTTKAAGTTTTTPIPTNDACGDDVPNHSSLCYTHALLYTYAGGHKR
jgi:hypothetical protein